LLDDRLPEDEQAELTAHVEVCADCRDVFDELAGAGRWWSDVRRYASAAAPPNRSAATISVPGTGSHSGGLEPETLPDATAVDFLDPPTEAGDLGRFGPYRVLGLIGRGGMGVVLRAFDTALHRPVAIKVLAPQLAVSATARHRFLREARAAASVVHDHVITIHAVDEAKGLPYLVMRLVEGKSLQERLDREGPLGLAEILRIGRQSAQGLAAAHVQGLVHRDIKPSNILLENGVERVKLSDFGLARAADDASLTQSGVIAGTPQYMAPEQARGEAVDHRADLFSLGSVLYAMCTGRPPFRAGTPLAVLRRVAEDTPRPIREVNPDIPESLAVVVARLHAKEPADRFQSAAEVAEVLGRHLAEFQGALPPRSLIDDDEIPAAKAVVTNGAVVPGRRALAWAVGLGLAVLVGLWMAEAVGAARVSDFLATVLRIPTRDGILVVEVDDPEVGVEVDGESIAIRGAGPKMVRLGPGMHHVRAERDGVSILDRPVEIRRGGRTIVSAKLESAPRPVDAPSGAADRSLRPPPGDVSRIEAATSFPRGAPIQVWSIAAHRGSAKSVAFTPDGRRALSGSGYPRGDQSMRLWDLESGRELQRFESDTGQVLSVAVSPDGRRALSGGQDPAVRLWDLSTGKLIREFHGHPATVNSVAFFGDGRRAVSAGFGDNVIRVWDVETGKEIQRCEGHTAPVYSVAVSPEGRQILSGGEDRTVRLWDEATGKEVRRFDGPSRFIESVAFSPDGRRALAGGHDAVAWVWDVDTGHLVARLDGHEGMIAAVAFTADGSRALTVVGATQGGSSPRGVMRLWDVESGRLLAGVAPADSPGLWSLAVRPGGQQALTGGADGRLRLWRLPPPAESTPARPQEFVGPVRSFEGHTDHPEALAVTRDGRWALSGSKDRTVRLWDLPTGRELKRFQGHEDEVSDVAISDDGRLAVSASLDRTVRIWDTGSGRELRRLKGHERKVRAVALSRDARLILSGSEENPLRLWDVATGQELRRLSGHTMGICCVAFSVDGRRALSGSVDGTGRLWDVASGSEVRTLTRGNSWVSAVAFLPDSRRALTGCVDGSVCLWDVETGEELRRFPRHGSMLHSLGSDPDGRLILAAGTGSLGLYDAASGRVAYTLRGVGGGIINAVLLPDARHIVFGCYNGALQLWRLPDGLTAGR
jgi:WD40 repeat protein